MTQLVKEVKRATQKGNISTNRFSTGKTRNSLAYHRLKNTCGYIFSPCPFVYERLHIRFGKNATTSSNGINHRRPTREFIQTTRIGFKQGSHLIDKSTRATSTGTIHSLLNSATKIGYLSIFTTKLNNNISLRDEFLHCPCRSDHFLNKIYTKPMRNSKTARAGYFYT